MDELEAEKIIEAALFMSSRPLSPRELGRLAGNISTGFVSQRLDFLKRRYEICESSVEIAEEEGKYFMRLRPEYASYVKEFSTQGEISRHALRTLAYVAKSEGITKRQLFLKLGGGIYDDVNELLAKGFVTAKKAGRTFAISTTPKFRMYFGSQKTAVLPSKTAPIGAEGSNRVPEKKEEERQEKLQTE